MPLHQKASNLTSRREGWEGEGRGDGDDGRKISKEPLESVTVLFSERDQTIFSLRDWYQIIPVSAEVERPWEHAKVVSIYHKPHKGESGE